MNSKTISTAFFLILLRNICFCFDSEQFNFGAATLGAGNTIKGDPAMSEYYPTELSYVKKPFITLSFKWAGGTLFHVLNEDTPWPQGVYNSNYFMLTSFGLGAPIDFLYFEKMGFFYSKPKIINFQDPVSRNYLTQSLNSLSLVLGIKNSNPDSAYSIKTSYKWIENSRYGLLKSDEGTWVLFQFQFSSLRRPKSDMGIGLEFQNGASRLGNASIRFYPTINGENWYLIFGYGGAMILSPGFYGLEYTDESYPHMRIGQATNKMSELKNEAIMTVNTLGTGLEFERIRWDIAFLQCRESYQETLTEREAVVNTFYYYFGK